MPLQAHYSCQAGCRAGFLHLRTSTHLSRHLPAKLLHSKTLGGKRSNRILPIRAKYPHRELLLQIAHSRPSQRSATRQTPTQTQTLKCTRAPTLHHLCAKHLAGTWGTIPYTTRTKVCSVMGMAVCVLMTIIKMTMPEWKPPRLFEAKRKRRSDSGRTVS
jgi:hypothetical protein